MNPRKWQHLYVMFTFTNKGKFPTETQTLNFGSAVQRSFIFTPKALIKNIILYKMAYNFPSIYRSLSPDIFMQN